MHVSRETKATYDAYAREYEQNTRDYVEKYIQEDLDLFLQHLKGKRIMDVGSGPGRDAMIFKQRGFHPVCVDISPSMVALCRSKGLEAYEMDMQHLDFPDASFDGVWAYTSLLHVPKSHVRTVIQRITDVLNETGMLYLGMKEGNFEGLRESEHYPGYKRYFSLYKKEEIAQLLTDFHMLHFSKVIIDREHMYMNFLCKKKRHAT